MAKQPMNNWLELNNWLQIDKNKGKKFPTKLLNYDKADWPTQLWHDLTTISGDWLVPFGNMLVTKNLIFKLKNNSFNDLTQADLPLKYSTADISKQFNFDELTAFDYTLNVFHKPADAIQFLLVNDWATQFVIETYKDNYAETTSDYILLPNKQRLLADYIAVLSRYFGGQATIYTYPYYFIGNSLESTYFYALSGVNMVCIKHPDFTLLTTYSEPTRQTWSNVHNANDMQHYFVVQSESKSRQPIEYFTSEFNNYCVELKNGVILLGECDEEVVVAKVRELNRREENMWNYYRLHNMYIPQMYIAVMNQLLSNLAGK